jgi:hypothetical protein
MRRNDFLKRQHKSREALANAAARYVALRAGDGQYSATVSAKDREGRAVTVWIRLDIISEETL